MLDGARIIKAVGVMLAEHEAQTESQLAAIRGETADAIAALPAPEPGEPGRDGTDRIMALPRWVKEGEACPVNELAWWKSGIWQSVRATSGSPADDPSGWACLVPGVHAIETKEDWTRRELVIGLRMSDGHLHECRSRMPATRLPPDYEQRGWGVLAGDTLLLEGGEFEMFAVKDGAQLDVADDWETYRYRGPRGQKVRGDPGPPGPPGPPGAGLIGLDIVTDPTGRGAALLPRYADKSVKAEPVVIDLMQRDPGEGRQVITCWAGPWNAGITYRRGDVVGLADGSGNRRLFLNTRAENAGKPGESSGWEAMT